MKLLIILIFSSFLLLFGGLVLRGERPDFWIRIINSGVIKKSDFLIENFLEWLKVRIKKLVLFLKNFSKNFFLSFLSFVFILNKIIFLIFKKLNRFFYRIYKKYHKQKPIKKQVSEYLKKIEEYKDEIANNQNRDEQNRDNF